LNSSDGKSIAISYFDHRNISKEMVEKFELGYSLDKWDSLYNHLIKNQFEDNQIINAGLILENNNKKYDRFRNRIIFPIHNLSGKVIAFGARIIKDEKNQPKYINSPETSLYIKSKVLYGLYQSKNNIRKEDTCYLVEGYTDVISLFQIEINNVVSSSGTSLTNEQIKLISRYTKNITILFDGDKAGIDASLRGMDLILENDMNVKIVSFPINLNAALQNSKPAITPSCLAIILALIMLFFLLIMSVVISPLGFRSSSRAFLTTDLI